MKRVKMLSPNIDANNVDIEDDGNNSGMMVVNNNNYNTSNQMYKQPNRCT